MLDNCIQSKANELNGTPALLTRLPLARVQLAGVGADVFNSQIGTSFLRTKEGNFISAPTHKFSGDTVIVDQQMWSMIRGPEVQPKYADIWWKLLHNRLPLRTRTKYFKGNEGQSETCLLCRTYDQTSAHFLLECD